MKRSLKYIVLILALVLVLVPSCRKDSAKVIPRSKLAKIYAEMLVTDQWIISTPKIRNIADTSLVYDPILAKYGYTPEDYQQSVMYYLNDPERFSRILRTSGELLDKELKVMRKEQAKRLRIKALMSSLTIPKLVLFQEDFPDKDNYNWSDSLKVRWDSLGNMWVTVREPRIDTVYEGVRLVVPVDTVEVAVVDTLMNK